MKNLKILAAVFSSGILLLTVACSTSEPAPTPPPATTAVDVSATDIAITGFTLSFSVAVPELAATDIKLDGDATVTSIKASGTENKVYTVVTSALTEGKIYNVSIGKANYTFNPAPLALTIPKSTDTKVNVTFSNITTTGFTLNLSAVVTGLVATDITLSNSAAVSSITGADTKTVNVVCSALTAGSTYTVTIAKAGFGFNPIPLTFIVPSAPVAGVQITDFRIVSPTIATLKTGVIAVSTGANTISNAPRWLHADKATVKAYFTLPTGATAAVGTTALASGDKLDLTSGTATIKVTNGTATADYTIRLAAYDATSNPYGIYTPGDLSDMRNGLAGSYKLMNDVTLPALTGGDADVVSSMAITDYATAGWLPVGEYVSSTDFTKTFSGKLDGNSKVVKNLSFIRSTVGMGLIGGSNNATITRLGVEIGKTGLTAKADYCGGLVGSLGGEISYCYVLGGQITAELTSSSNGGLVGVSINDTNIIKNSYSTVEVSSNNAFTGGLVGSNLGSISNCFSSARVNCNQNYSAGLVGRNISNGVILNCFSTGVVSSNSRPVGGFLAMNGGTVNYSYWDTSSSGKASGIDEGTNTGVTGKTTAEMKAGTPYDATWTAANWTFTAGQYPKLVGVGGQN